MRILRLWLLVSLVAIVPMVAQPVPATLTPSTPKEQKALRLIELSNSPGNVDQIFDQMKTLLASQAPAAGASPEQKARTDQMIAKLLDLMKPRMEKLKPQMAKIYSDNFTEQEIDGMLAFYDSPAGRAMLKKLPEMTTQIVALTQGEMQQLMPEIIKLAQEASRPTK